MIWKNQCKKIAKLHLIIQACSTDLIKAETKTQEEATINSFFATKPLCQDKKIECAIIMHHWYDKVFMVKLVKFLVK
jgi:hypothetical protein